MEKKLSVNYLLMGIFGSISAIPVLGGIVDILILPPIILCGCSIYILVVDKNGKKRKISAILLISAIITGFLATICAIKLFMNIFGLIDPIASTSNDEINNLFSGLLQYSMLGFILMTSSLVLKILGAIFAFNAYNELKNGK